MTRLLDQVIERLRELPETQQDLAAAEIKNFVELIDAAQLQLSDEQVAEVERRRAKKTPTTLTMTQLDDRIARRLRGA